MSFCRWVQLLTAKSQFQLESNTSVYKTQCVFLTNSYPCSSAVFRRFSLHHRQLGSSNGGPLSARVKTNSLEASSVCDCFHPASGHSVRSVPWCSPVRTTGECRSLNLLKPLSRYTHVAFVAGAQNKRDVQHSSRKGEDARFCGGRRKRRKSETAIHRERPAGRSTARFRFPREDRVSAGFLAARRRRCARSRRITASLKWKCLRASPSTLYSSSHSHTKVQKLDGTVRTAVTFH